MVPSNCACLCNAYVCTSVPCWYAMLSPRHCLGACHWQPVRCSATSANCIDRGALTIKLGISPQIYESQAIKVQLVISNWAEHCCCPIGMVHTYASVVLIDWIWDTPSQGLQSLVKSLDHKRWDTYSMQSRKAVLSCATYWSTSRSLLCNSCNWAHLWLTATGIYRWQKSDYHYIMTSTLTD